MTLALVRSEKLPVTREQFAALEEAMRELPNQIEADRYTSHFFGGGVYIRSLFKTAGTLSVGKIHRFETMNVLVFGTLKVITNNGGMEEITGPRVFVTPPGTKKTTYAMTDCLLFNIHPTTLTDVDEIEKTFIVPDFKTLDQELEQELLS